MNAKLEAKLIVLDRAGKVPDVDKAMTELSEALEVYWEKWEMVRSSNKLILMEVELRTSASLISMVRSCSFGRTMSKSNCGVAGRVFSAGERES